MGVAGFRTAAERTSADDGPAACSFVHLHATPRKPMRQLLKNTFTLALALVFTAGMAFGQHLEDIEQTNTTNTTADANEALVEQINQSHTVEGLDGGSGMRSSGNALTQIDGSNLMLEQFTGPSGTKPGNIFRAEQLVGHQTIDARQLGSNNLAEIDQRTGTGNTAKIEQDGSNAEAYIDQFGNNNFAGHHFDSPRTVQVSGWRTAGSFFPYAAQGSDSDLELLQDGDGNQLYFQQSTNDQLRLDQSGGAYAEILQRDGGNIVAENQDGVGMFESPNSDLLVEQTGGGNTVYGTQDSGSNTGLIDQNGTGNTVCMIQTTGLSPGC
jgi:hypothetical protein